MFQKTIGIKSENCEILDSGFLKIKARPIKEGVFSFSRDEIPSFKTDAEVVNVYYPLKEIASKSKIKKLMNAPVVVEHKEINVDNSNDIVGNVVGEPYINEEYVECELLITNKETIKKIGSKEVSDLSVSFRGQFVEQPGEYEGRKYDGYFKNIKYDHIALLKPFNGRLGNDIRVLNKKGEEMEDTNNLEKKIKEMDELIVKGKTDLEEKINKLLNEKKETEEELLYLREENAKLLKEISEENLAKKMENIAKERADAQVVCEASEIKVDNSGLSGEKLYRNILGAVLDVSNWGYESLKCGFEVAVAMAKKNNSRVYGEQSVNNSVFVTRSIVNADEEREERIKRMLGR